MTRSAALAASLLAALVLASGCNPLHDETPGEPNGIADMTAGEALTAMTEALSERTDVTYTGIETVQSLPNMPVTVSHLDNGRCEMVVASAKGRMDLRMLPKRMFVRVDAPAALAILNLGTAETKLVANKWIAAPVDAATRESCDLIGALGDKKLRTTLEAGEVTTVEKREVRKFSGRDKDGSVTFYIATTDLPLPIQISGQSKDGFFKLVLAGHDRGLVVEAPEDVVDTTG